MLEIGHGICKPGILGRFITILSESTTPCSQSHRLLPPTPFPLLFTLFTFLLLPLSAVLSPGSSGNLTRETKNSAMKSVADPSANTVGA